MGNLLRGKETARAFVQSAGAGAAAPGAVNVDFGHSTARLRLGCASGRAHFKLLTPLLRFCSSVGHQLDAGVLPQLVLGDPTAPRFVFWEGRLRPVPGGPADLPFFDLMSPLGKIRAGLGAMGLRPGPPADVRT